MMNGWMGCVAKDRVGCLASRRVFGITADWSTAALDPGGSGIAL